jgi:hypothetical protein
LVTKKSSRSFKFTTKSISATSSIISYIKQTRCQQEITKRTLPPVQVSKHIGEIKIS